MSDVPPPGGGLGALPALPLSECWQFEERALNAWPSLQTALVGGWLLRFADGFTKRANSACAMPGSAPLDEVLPEIEERYRRRGIACCVRLTPFAPPGSEAALLARGWRIVDETLIEVAPVSPAPGTSHEGLTLAERADPGWIDGYAAASARPDLRRDTLGRMLAAIGTPTAFATLSVGREPVAFGLAVRERGAVGLFDIATVPDRRGHGYGTRLVSGLLAWAAAAGDRTAYLQVTAGNRPALSLYRRLGFAEVYRYVYAMPPSDRGS